MFVCTLFHWDDVIYSLVVVYYSLSFTVVKYRLLFGIFVVIRMCIRVISAGGTTFFTGLQVSKKNQNFSQSMLSDAETVGLIPAILLD